MLVFTVLENRGIFAIVDGRCVQNFYSLEGIESGLFEFCDEVVSELNETNHHII